MNPQQIAIPYTTHLIRTKRQEQGQPEPGDFARMLSDHMESDDMDKINRFQMNG